LQSWFQQGSMAPIAWETIVGRVRVAGFSVSLDGYGAGPEQGLDTPLGKGGPQLFGWFFGTKTFRAMTGRDGGSGGVDEGFAHRSMDGFGAFILGRNMFGPERGPWPDSDWKGWWGDNPPYHAPTYILTHHPRDPIVMEGGTTFHFVTDGIHAALDLAARRRGTRTSRSAAALRPFANIWKRALSTRRILPSPRTAGSGGSDVCRARPARAGLPCGGHHALRSGNPCRSGARITHDPCPESRQPERPARHL
jgi:dihydrofolate reductase